MTVTYEELLVEIKKLDIEEVRVNSDNLFELVIKVNLLTNLHFVLQDFFGPPFKPAGEIPSRTAQEYSSSFGGIRSNQTMYYIKHDNFCSRAMIWPWNDGTHVTVKIFRSQKT